MNFILFISESRRLLWNKFLNWYNHFLGAIFIIVTKVILSKWGFWKYKNICKICIRSCRKVSLKLENEAFSSIFSDLKLVLDYSLSCTWESCYLGGLSSWGIADLLEFRGSACRVLVFCIPMFKIIYIYGGPNFREAIFIPPFDTGYQLFKCWIAQISGLYMFKGSAVCKCWGWPKFD